MLSLMASFRHLRTVGLDVVRAGVSPQIFSPQQCYDFSLESKDSTELD